MDIKINSATKLNKTRHFSFHKRNDVISILTFFQKNCCFVDDLDQCNSEWANSPAKKFQFDFEI